MMKYEQLAREYGEACQRNLQKDEEIERLRSYRDSWKQRASDRLKDCVKFIGEIEYLRAENERLREEVMTLRVRD